MNKNKFDTLVYIERNQNMKVSQREIADHLVISLGTVNRGVNDLLASNYIVLDDGFYKVTEAGYRFLEPYEVKRAIFLAAGFGSRLVPVTYNTPKPLVRVLGTRMIDTLLDAVIEAGIEEIYVVRGFLKEQFDTLLPKYPMLKFIDNDVYNIANNISSAYLVRDLLQNALVLESDLYLSDKTIINKYEFATNYKALKVDRTDDWCFDTLGQVITKVSIGGVDTHEMCGLSYWDAKDGAQMEHDLLTAYEMPGGKELYWDEVPLKVFAKNYRIIVDEIKPGSIIEIDTYGELCEIDPIYKTNIKL